MATGTPASASPAATTLWAAPFMSPAPAGQTANLLDPPGQMNRTIAILTVEVAFIILSYLFRMIAKICLLRRVSWEDAWISIGVSLFLARIIMGTIGVSIGFGLHQWDVTYGTVSTLLHFTNNIEIVFVFTIFAIKLAILLQYLHFFAPSRKGHPRMWRTIITLLVLNSALYSCMALVDIFGCWPREKFWDPKVPGTCINEEHALVAFASLNVVSDFATFILPIVAVCRLNLSRREKAGVAVILGVGGLGCVCGLLRTLSGWLYSQDTDVTYHLFWMGIWGGAELACGILATNMPYCAQLFRAFRRRRGSFLRRSDGKDVDTSLSSVDSMRQKHDSAADPEKYGALLVEETMDKEEPSSVSEDDTSHDLAFYESLFCPPTLGTVTRRHELESGIRPGTIVTAMRRHLIEDESRHGSNQSSEPTVVDDGEEGFDGTPVGPKYGPTAAFGSHHFRADYPPAERPRSHRYDSRGMQDDTIMRVDE